MYYGYNDKKKIIMADQEFIELLGYSSFKDVLRGNIDRNIKFEDSKIHLSLSDKSIRANYSKVEFFTERENVNIVKLSNIIETKNSISKLQLNYEPIYLDVEKISKEIGLSVDDYKLYLDSFIDQSIIDEKKLFAGDDKAIKNLANLALTLKIPNINILLLKIKKLPHEERTQYIDEYYTKLALLTLKKPKNRISSSSETNTKVIERDIPTIDINDDEVEEELLDSRFTELLQKDTKSSSPPKPSKEKKREKNLFINEPTVKKEEPPKPREDAIDLNMNDFDLGELDDLDNNIIPLTGDIGDERDDGTVEKISLDNVEPIPIDYNPKVAADELNLPVVLIEEFVEDFIEQAHHDKDHLLASYYQRDMDNIHELGHKLKGAASNLRINELADVLEEIQFCTEHSKLKSLFIRFWGLFISLEKHMKQAKQ